MSTAFAPARCKDLAAACKIDGWLSQREAGTLYDLAVQANGPIIEIGSWRGRSTAALALGSMAGNKHSVYAVDPFIGVPPGTRHTEMGELPGWKSSSPELLRANLDGAGVNGLVKIVAKSSMDALADVPQECGMLFIDGDHSKPAVEAEIAKYVPLVKDGGYVVFHDATDGNPGVFQAVNEYLLKHGNEWRQCGRFDSALVMRKVPVERRSVFLASPGAPRMFNSVKGLMQATLGSHDVVVENNCNGWDDMNILWVSALNKFEAGEITHFAMLHTDIVPVPGWLDLLIGEMEDTKADIISVPAPLKDNRGLTSSGIGDPNDRWGPFRRFTMRELVKLPATFGIEDTPHPDKYLLHNTGCWLLDLRNPIFRQTDERGYLKAVFNFPVGAVRTDKGWASLRESEDWYFSRMVHELGAKSLITRKVELFHMDGGRGYGNQDAWGDYKAGDEDTAHKWRK